MRVQRTVGLAVACCGMGLGADAMGQILCMNKLYFRLEHRLQCFNSSEDLYFGGTPSG